MVDSESAMDIIALFHAILFAYQKKVKDILGSGEVIFVRPVLKTVSMLEEKGTKIIEGETLDQTFENLAKKLMDAKLVRNAWLEKLTPKRFYRFHVEGCAFAKHVHDVLKPRDVTCPYALVAMSILQSATGKKVTHADSEFTDTGSKTLIGL